MHTRSKFLQGFRSVQGTEKRPRIDLGDLGLVKAFMPSRNPVRERSGAIGPEHTGTNKAVENASFQVFVSIDGNGYWSAF